MSDCGSGSCSTGSCSSDKDRLPPGMLSVYNLNQQTGLGTLIWAETVKEGDSVRIHPAVFEILGKIRSISDDRIFAMITGTVDIKPLYKELFEHGVDTLYHIRGTSMVEYRPEAYAEALADLSDRVNPMSIIIAGTTRGREVAPLTAALLKTGLTADCTELSMDDGKLVMTRPAFGGDLLATIVCEKHPQMATVRPGIFKSKEPEKDRTGTVISRPFKPRIMKEIVSEDPVPLGESITDAKILISLGNGIKDKSLIDVAEEIASLIGAKVSCSRALTEKGWFDRSRQVGQSGTAVSPDLYIAFGISGSSQHMAGVRAKRIISVNKDPDAPINSLSDKCIIGDASEILKQMLRSLQK